MKTTDRYTNKYSLQIHLHIAFILPQTQHSHHYGRTHHHIGIYFKGKKISLLFTIAIKHAPLGGALNTIFMTDSHVPVGVTVDDSCQITMKFTGSHRSKLIFIIF